MVSEDACHCASIKFEKNRLKYEGEEGVENVWGLSVHKTPSWDDELACVPTGLG